MAVGAARECSEQRSHSDDSDAVRKFRAFKIPVTATTDDPLTAAGLPEQDDAHPQRTDLVCLRRNAHLINDGDWHYYIVVAEYVTEEVAEAERQGASSAAAAIASSGSNPKDPTTQPETGGGGASVTASKVLYKDLDSKAVVNGAKQPFAEAVTTPLTFARFTRSRNLSIEPIDKSTTHVGTVNINTFHGRERDTVLCDSITWTVLGRKNKNGTHSIVGYKTTAHFLYNPNKFNPLEVLNCGFCQLKGTELEMIRDKWGVPLSQPSLLSESGFKLASGAEPDYIDFRVYKRNDHNVILMQGNT